MKNFFNLRPDSLGLHITDSSIKIAKLKKRGSFFSLASFNKTELPPDIIKEAKVQNKEKFMEYFKKSLKTAKGDKIKTRNIIFSVPEKSAFITVIKMPKLPEQELKKAIPFEAENYIPFKLEEVYCDFEIIPNFNNNSDKLDILLASVPKKIVDPYVECFKKMGFFSSALEIECQSIARAVIKNGITAFPVLIIDFEEDYTNLIIYLNGSLILSSSIPISSFHFNSAISKNLKCSLIEAEKLKLKYGLDSKKDKTAKQVSDSLMIFLSELSGQIKKYIDYYQNHQEKDCPHKELKEIIICGKEANLKGLSSFFSFSLGIEVKTANPWVNILPFPLKELPELSFEQSLEYTAGLGLALRGIKEEII